MRQNNLVRVFFNADMRNGHDGLRLLARTHKIDMDILNSNEFVCFVNRRQTQLKLFAPDNVIAHYKSDKRIDVRTIRLIPRFFNGRELIYDEALRQVLEKNLTAK